jgi:hypothetical protein
MSGTVVKFPDGASTKVDSSNSFGRDTPASLSDQHLSRQLLTPVEGQPLVLRSMLLSNQGQNRKHRMELHLLAALWEYLR